MGSFGELLIKTWNINHYQGNDKKVPKPKIAKLSNGLLKISHKQYQELIKKVYKTLETDKHQRFGQCLYNQFYDLNPNMAKYINGSSCDPFHTGKHENSESVCLFYDAVVDQNL